MKSERIRTRTEPMPGGGEGGDLDLMDLLAQLLARKWTIAWMILLGAVIGTGIGQLPPNQFRAAALVQIENRQTGIPLPSELIGEMLSGQERPGPFMTEIHVIRSRLILDPVVAELRLDLVALPEKAPLIGDMLMRRPLPVIQSLLPARYARVGERLILGDLDMPVGMERESLSLLVLEGGQVRVSLPDGQEVTGAAPGLVDLPGGGQVEITRLQAAPGRVFTLRQRPVREAAAFVRDRLAVQERGQTGIVDFGFTGSAWDDNRRIVNAVIANYQDQNLRRRAAEIDQSIAFISTQLPEVQAALTAATEDLRQFRSLRQTEELSRNTQDTLGRMVQIETRLEEIAFRKEQALQRVTENHPDYRALDFEEEQLRSRLAALREDLSDLPETERELAGLTAQLERARQLEIQLASRVEQLRVLRASAVSNIRVLEWAETALHVGPDRRRPIIFGAVAGLLLAVMGVLGLNVLRRGIEDARTIEAMGLSLFATVEKVPALAGASSADPRYGIALSDSRNTATEALRGLRTGLRFSLAASGSKTLMITSCAPADGKSFVSLNLAMVSGQAGARVLLIDADMRRGILRRYFGLSARTPGLSDLLAGSADLDQVVHRHDASGIDFIPTGAYPPNPAELLAGPVLKRLLDYVDEAYDLVIVDAPPVLAVTDPGIIGQTVGMSLLIVRHLVTTGPELQSVVKTMETAGVAFSGVVLNQFDRRASRYGAYGAKYGYYHGGYQYKYDT